MVLSAFLQFSFLLSSWMEVWASTRVFLVLNSDGLCRKVMVSLVSLE